jgi:hypothetical protein
VKVLVITALAVNVEHNHEGGQQYKTNWSSAPSSINNTPDSKIRLKRIYFRRVK